MLCPKCNTQIPDHYRFCPVCGNDLSAHNQAVQSSAYQTQSQNPGYNGQAPAAAKKPFKFLPWILLACGVLVVAAAAIVIIVLSDGSGGGNNTPIQPQVSNSSGTTSSAKKSYLGTWETGISFTNAKSKGYAFDITADSVTCKKYSAGEANIIGNYNYTVSSDGPYTRLILSAASKQSSTISPSDRSNADDYSNPPETTEPHSYVPVPSSAFEEWDVTCPSEEWPEEPEPTYAPARAVHTASSPVNGTRTEIDADFVGMLILINPGLMVWTDEPEPDPNYEWGEYELLYRRDTGTDELPLDDSMKAECMEVLGEDFTHLYFPATRILVLGNDAGKFYQFYIRIDGTAQFMEAIVLSTATDLKPNAVRTDHNFIITDTQ